MNFDNTYLRLGEAFSRKIRPAPVRDPRLLLWNAPLAERLRVSDGLNGDSIALAQMFSGNSPIPGSEPIATAYAGHQFGQFVPQLGDGRAHLLGEIRDRLGKRWDIQLKGSGRTAFSRGGDGRCALGPAIREFVMSEAMHALGVPTARTLAVVATGETVFRQRPLPGAVVTRVAASHLRIGTFQYFAARGDHSSLRTLADYAIERHDPALREAGPDRFVSLIEAVMERQIRLVVAWMRVGFIHGVMNTDNTALSGETIDYGPCAMMGIYDPETVYSSIDTVGRYAFGNQPGIVNWNLARFAECLLPLIDSNPERALDRVGPLVTDFPRRFETAFMTMMGKKLGIRKIQAEDRDLIVAVLRRMRKERLDYTVTFDGLTRSLTDDAAADAAKEGLGETFPRWQKRLNEQREERFDIQERMRRHNPVVIPRNHHVERVIEEGEETGSVVLAKKFLKVLASPYQRLAETPQFQDPPADGDAGYKTFCGT